MVSYEQIKSAVQALTYFADCQVATFQDVILRSRSGKCEILQHALLASRMISQATRFAAGAEFHEPDLERVRKRFGLALTDAANRWPSLDLQVGK